MKHINIKDEETGEDKDTDVSYAAIKENVGFPFREERSADKGKYYVFNSEEDVVRFTSSGNTTKESQYYYGSGDNAGVLTYYHDKGNVNNQQVTYNGKASFFPFNTPEDATTRYNAVTKIEENDVTRFDYAFGTKMIIPFYITEDGMQPEEDGGKPMKFSFSGDDDMWIFIDGELVLDLGGAHGATTGSIDFSTAGNKMTVKANTVAFQKDGTSVQDSHDFEATNTVIESVTKEMDIVKGPETKDSNGNNVGGIHYMTVFYMERGMFESNFDVEFNFIAYSAEEEIVVPTPTPTPSPTPSPTAVPAATPTPRPAADNAGTLSVWNVLDDSNVNDKFKSKVKDVILRICV